MDDSDEDNDHSKNKSKSLTTSINEEDDPTEVDDEEQEPKLYEGKSPLGKAWWLSKVFFTWLNPLIKFTMKHGSLKFENFGEIRDRDKAYHQIAKLDKVFRARAERGVTRNTLIMAIFSCYKGDLIYLMSCNLASILLMYL